jgi:hypothetical protein
MKRSGKASSMKRNGKASMTTLARHLYNLYNLLLTLHSSPSTLLSMPKEVIEEVNNDVPFELVDDVDYGGNAEVIESPVRPRRGGRERQATKRSLDYHKKMRKGR